ncbi:MAG TPA: AraC family transcriptional regulator [Bryobacteraceae bacterium]
MKKKQSGGFLGSVVGHGTSQNFSVVETLYHPQENLSCHSHDNAFVSIALRGNYYERSGSKTWECATGAIIFHAPGESHADRFYESGGQLLNLELFPHFVQTLETLGFQTGDRIQLKSPYLLQLGLRLQNEIRRKDTAWELTTEGLALELIAELIRQRESRISQPRSDWLSQVRDLLHDEFRKNLTLKELAQSVDVHPVHLARAFRKRHHCCVGDYVRRLRVESACSDLSTSSLPIVEVAARNGFADQSHMSRVVKRYTGLSPHEFRQRPVPFIAQPPKDYQIGHYAAQPCR